MELLAFPIFHLIALPVFISLIYRRWLLASIIFIACVVVSGIVCAFYTLLSFGGAFGPGVMLFFSSCLLVPLFFIVLLLGWRRIWRKTTGDRRWRVTFLVGALVIFLVQFAPVIGSTGIGGYCDLQTMKVAQPLLAALQKYHQDTQTYPEDLEHLVPEYIPNLPVHQCFAGLDIIRFQLKRCQEGVILLTAPSTDGVQILRYNFNSGVWSGISFLDGSCSFLR